jgi:hypothetical protein
MHTILGEPVASGVLDGEEYEEFRTHKVIAKDQTMKYLSEGYAMLWFGTFGTFDLVCVSYELGRLGKRTLFGQTIRVTYWPGGSIAKVERDGESVLGNPLLRRVGPPTEHLDASSLLPASP